MVVARVSEGFLHKGNGFLEGSTMKERNFSYKISFSCKISCHGTLIDATKNHYVVFFV